MARPVKPAGKSTIQARRDKGESYRKQAAKSMGRSLKNHPPKPGKR